jgi:hypothetical protein
VTDTERLNWLESQLHRYGDGITEPREVGLYFDWQQTKAQPEFPGLRQAIDEQMRAVPSQGSKS